MNNKSAGTNYENLTRKILMFNKLSFSLDDKSPEICFNNAKIGLGFIHGISTAKHQIDVHLEKGCFHLIGECKFHKSKVNKANMATFITVFKDIQAKHKSWNILPVFVSDSGFQPGAIKLAKYYDIVMLHLKNDFASKPMSLSLKISCTTPKFENIKYFFTDKSIISNSDLCFSNLDYGLLDFRSLLGHLDRFKDINGNIIDWRTYKGSFTVYPKSSETYPFIELISNKILDHIEGEIVGTKKSKEKSSKYVFKRVAVINIDGKRYNVFEDGDVHLINYS